MGECQELCSSWPLGTQEDACEFMQHIMPSHVRSLLVRVVHDSVHITGRRAHEVQESFFVSVHVGDVTSGCTLQALLDRKFGLADRSGGIEPADGWSHEQHFLSTASGLILHLARFSFDRVNLRAHKVCTKLAIGTELALSCSPMQNTASGLPGEVVRKGYTLTSVVCHHGDSIQNGHYTAYILMGTAGGDRVCHFDDLCPFPASTCSVADLIELIKEDAYILFYRLS